MMNCSISSKLDFISQKSSSVSHFSVLTLQEGKQLLQQLIPGSKGYIQLQNLLLKTAGIFEITIHGTSYKINTFSNHCRLLGGFGGSEHAAIGEEVSLQGLELNEPILTVGPHQLQFSHIVALAGDFYAIPGEAISLPGGDDNAKTVRFQNSFNTLVKADHEELKALLAEIASESREVQSSGTPHHCYSHCNAKGMNTLKKIKKDYEDLLIDNSDHFEKNAEDAYRIGHQLAIQVAKEAGKTQNKEKLKEAYALDAFACHFLTDLFAAGHIRNQRGDLEIVLRDHLEVPKMICKKLAGVLTGAQHEEDGKHGLEVQNREGKTWKSYGDGFYFSPKSQDNQERVIEAVRRSADEICKAYKAPEIEFISRVKQLIPQPTNSNHPPLYTVKNNSLILYKKDHSEHYVQKSIFALGAVLSHALNYLPQSYIDGFIAPDQENSPWISKLLLPQLERMTGAYWRSVGVASHHQVDLESRQINDKLDEMAATVQKTYENTIEVLSTLQSIKNMLQRSEVDHLKDFQESIKTIKRNWNEIQSSPIMAEGHIPKLLDDLYDAIKNLRYLCNEKILLRSYVTQLTSSSQKKDFEIKICTTLWFREFLEFQTQGFYLYLHLNMLSNKDRDIDLLHKEFVKNLQAQVQANQEFIEKTLIESSSSYIKLQLQKMAILNKPSFIIKN